MYPVRLHCFDGQIFSRILDPHLFLLVIDAESSPRYDLECLKTSVFAFLLEYLNLILAQRAIVRLTAMSLASKMQPKKLLCSCC